MPESAIQQYTLHLVLFMHTYWSMLHKQGSIVFWQGTGNIHPKLQAGLQARCCPGHTQTLGISITYLESNLMYLSHGSLINGFIEYPCKTGRTWGINVTLQRVFLQAFEWNIWNCHDSNLKSCCLFKFAFIWHRKPGNREGLWENMIPSIIYLPYSCREIKY